MSSRDLARALDTIRVYPDRQYVQKPDHAVINWGSSRQPNWENGRIYNKPSRVAYATNKLRSLYKFNEFDVPTVEWTEYSYEADRWREWDKVFARTILTGHSGKGIVVCTTELVPAPLYTKEFKKTNEYRVHVWGNEVLDIQEKRKRLGTGPSSDCDIWNHGNDFVFARQNVECPDSVKDAAILAVKALGLDFGAADVGYNTNGDVAVFEVNTAPGLTGTTLTKYVEKINEL
jgi:glutathione synthase/RimK-type ligase-like ATP-grasp enzyme